MSLFDGIAGFPLAGAMAGMRPVYASEVESYPMRVSAARFPDMVQLGDVTKISGADIEPVDVVTFGSPCQDLSVAGKQLGIHDGQRSSLFFEAIRIIKEMRNADKNRGRADKFIRPRFAVWENVPGAFSSNGGADFRAVLEAIASICENDISIPRPKKWGSGGGMAGYGWSLAWRVYDAQYWGVPQRRKRIYLVADFGSERAPEILFEREGVCWNPAQGRAAREGATVDAERSTGRSGGVRCLNPWDSQSIRQYDVNGIAPNINANSHGGQNRWGVCYPAAFMGGQGAKAGGIGYCDDGTTPTIRAAESGSNQVPDVCYALKGNFIDRDTKQNGIGWRDGEMYTLDATDRHGLCYPEIARGLCARADSSPCVDRGQNVVCYEGQNVCTDTEVAFTLQAGRPDDHHIPGMAYEATAFAWANSGNAGLSDGEVSPTIKAARNGEPAVCALDCRNMTGNEELSGTLQAKNEGGFSLNFVNPVVYAQQRIGQYAQDTIGSTEMARDYKSAKDLVVESSQPPRKYIVRRLTPLECVRLQGYPDCWLDGVEGSDSAKYKALGNSLAIPCAFDVMNRIARFVEREKED